MRKLFNTAAVVITALAAASGATAVQAQNREVTETKVSVNHIDFNNQAEVAATYARLKATARAACDSGYARDLRAVADDRACAQKALAEVVGKLDRPMLTAMHAGETQSVFAAEGYAKNAVSE